MRKMIKKVALFMGSKPDIWFFFLFTTTFTLSVRKVVYFFPIEGAFNEYTGVYIYLSDIFLFLTIFYWACSILYNNKYLLSIKKAFHNCSTWNNQEKISKLFHVEHMKLSDCCSEGELCDERYVIVPRGTITGTYAQLVNNYVLLFPLMLGLFAFSSILWATNYVVALHSAIRLAGFILLFYYIYFRIVPRGTIKVHKKNCSTWNNFRKFLIIIILVSTAQALVGILQVLTQHSLGIIWLKESIISSEIAGVAKLIFNEQAYIRAYGLMPHPNILGGLLAFSILVTLFYVKMFHVEQCSIIVAKNDEEAKRAYCSTWNNTRNLFRQSICKMFHVEQFCFKGFLLLKSALLLQVIAMLLTFSKSAISGLLIGYFVLNATCFNVIVPRGTRKIRILFHVEQFRQKILITLIGVFAFLLTSPNFNSLFINSLLERVTYLKFSVHTFLLHPFLGIGAGQFVVNMLGSSIEYWKYQPVHNVFLLILNEFGLIIFVLFLSFIYKLYQDATISRNCSTWNNFRSNHLQVFATTIIIMLIPIMMFDHYLWDIQQGKAIFWIVLAIAAGTRNRGLL